MKRLRRRGQRLHVPFTPEQNQRARLQQSRPRRCQKEAVATSLRSSACPSQSLEERCHRPRRIHLDDAVKVADVDPQLKSAGGNNDAVSCFTEGCFRVTTLFRAQRTVGDERGDALGPEIGGQLFRPGPAITEHEPLLSAMEALQDRGCVLEIADEVNCYVCFRGWCTRRRHNYRFARRATCEPMEQLLRIPNRCRQPDSLHVLVSDVPNPLKDGKQMPSAVIARECMDLVDDDRAHRSEEKEPVRPPGDQQRFQALRRGQQNVGWLGERPRLHRLSDVSMPEAASPTHERGVKGQPLLKVVQ
jgi:hypothetical protein